MTNAGVVKAEGWTGVKAAVRVAVALVALLGTKTWASGPRFVTGTTFGAAQPGQPMAFRIHNPLYYTDPGALSASVTHAQADAMVAAAVAVWNIPTASLVIAKGGLLNEHVSAANSTAGANGVTFPADVAASNYLSKPIAVIFDTDGSVINLLLGAGASDLSSCRQNGVVENVDGFGAAGTIDHAVILVNGLCATDAGDALTQLQWQTERAFGRILGLAWSQVNDNVFTGATPATQLQISYWPVMHPIEPICGPYTYKCYYNPFPLRPDDRNGLEQLYPVIAGNAGAGKVASTSNSVSIRASLGFPTGQGMDLVNVTVRRMPIGLSEVEPFEVTSGVSGVQYQQAFSNAVTGALSITDSIGTNWQPAAAIMSMPYIEVPSSGATLYMQTEAINPLYVREYAIGPYQRPPVTPSGSVQQFVDYSAGVGSMQIYDQTVNDAAASCDTGADGVEGNPIPVALSGTWAGLLCSVGHTSWGSMAVRAGRSWTVEVTALDESGAATLYKAQPVIGIWQSTDAVGTSPAVAHNLVAMNAFVAGMTQIKMPVTASDKTFRFAVADQFGGGRPDFAYAARVLYADSISPSVVGSGGGQVTVYGRGFQAGMTAKVNGALATVVSTTATTMVLQTPTATTARGTSGSGLNVVLSDAVTGGSTTMIGALRYSNAAADGVVLVSAPATMQTGVQAGTAFAVRVMTADGSAGIAGATVQMAVASGAAQMAICGGAASCAAVSDANGLVQTAVTGNAAGPVVLTATEVSGGRAVSATVVDSDPVRSVAIATAAGAAVADTAGSWTVVLAATQDGAAAGGVPVVWSATAGLTVAATGVTAANGQATVMVNTTGLPGGTMGTVTGCVWTSVCASWQVSSVTPVRTVAIGSAPVYLAAGASGSWTVGLTAVQNGAGAAGAPVSWTVTAGGQVSAARGVTNAGAAATTVSVGAIGPGATVTVTGCVWSTVCTSWTVRGVEVSQWTVAAVGGVGQSVSAGTALGTVSFQATDGAGHAVEGVPLTIYQTVDGWEGVCATQGRCAAAPVLASSQQTIRSDAGGMVNVTPLEVAGVAQVVNLAAASGAAGFLTLTLTVTP